MLLFKIKRRFAHFVRSFDERDIDLAMQFVALAVEDYREDKAKFISMQINTWQIKRISNNS